jgi:transcriptional regulator with XRE-family HTH domain
MINLNSKGNMTAKAQFSKDDFKRLRIDKGLTQKELGRRVGYSARTIEKFEQGTRAILPRVVLLIKAI